MWSGLVDAIAGDDSTDADDIDGPGAGAGDRLIELLSVMSQCSTI